jgi:hypothetical protein
MVDVVVVSAQDTVVFDRDDSGKVSCKTLHTDPHGTLVIQGGSGDRTICVDGTVESFGAIKIDASAAGSGTLTLRLVSQAPEERFIRLIRGGSILVMGKEGLPEGKYNAVVSSGPAVAGAAPLLGHITGGERTMIDLQRSCLENIEVAAGNIDNTGSKPNERLNITGNRFIGLSRLSASACDTPTVTRNEFVADKDLPVPVAAINLQGCPLAEIKHNKIVGPYPIGIQTTGECSATGNTIEKCVTGIYWYGYNAMIKQNTIREVDTGLTLTTVSGSIEDLVVDKCKVGITADNTVAQLTNVSIANVATNGCPVSLNTSCLTILNCNIKPDKIRCTKSPHPDVNLPWAEAMQYLVVKANGKLPPKVQVEVRTAKPEKPIPEGGTDLNVRNSPAMVLPNGMTPLPGSLTPLIVKSWKRARDGTVLAAPEYTLSIWEPPAKAGDKPKTLKTMSVKPDESWFRAKPNDASQALEVTVP